MLGIPASVTSIVLSSGAALVVDTHSVIQASVSPGSDTLKNITNTNTNAKDILALIAKSVDTITVSHNDSGTGNIFLLGAVNKVLLETAPMFLFRVGNNWYEFNNSTGITNAQVTATAAIAYGKLNLSGSIVNADINASAAIAASKINGTAAVLNVNNVFTAGLTMSSADITLAGNKLKTSNYNYLDIITTDYGQVASFQNSGTNNPTRLALIPNGTGKASWFTIYRTSDVITDREIFSWGADRNATGEFFTAIEKQGAGVARPWNVYMNGTRVWSYDTALTNTSYVQLIVNSNTLSSGNEHILLTGNNNEVGIKFTNSGTGGKQFSFYNTAGGSGLGQGYLALYDNSDSATIFLARNDIFSLSVKAALQTAQGTTASLAIDTSGGSTITVANNGTSNITGSQIPYGIFFIKNEISGETALFAMHLGGPLIINQSTGNKFSVASGTASKTNLYISGGASLQLENKEGSSMNYKITVFKMGIG